MARGMEMVRVVDDGVITTGKIKKKKKKKALMLEMNRCVKLSFAQGTVGNTLGW